MSNIEEPTKDDVLSIADYLGCNGEELWSEVCKLLTRQHDFAEQELWKEIHEEAKNYDFYLQDQLNEIASTLSESPSRAE